MKTIKPVALLLVAALPLSALADTATYQRVDFSTEVAREVANDQMNAVLSIEISEKNPAKLAAQLASVMNDSMRQASAYANVKVTTGNQNTWPVYGSSITSSSKLEGWRGRSELRIESRDFKAAAELISKLQEKLQLNGVSFSVSAESRRKTEESLTTEAIAAFKSKAATVQKAWDAKSYKLVQMSLGSAGGQPPYMPMVRAMKSAEADSIPSQEMAAGDTRLVVSVSGSIELQP